LPPDPPLSQDEELTCLLTQAAHAVGRLNGLSQIIPDPDFFVYLYVRKEALLSSQIEGTQCSLEDILSPNARNKFCREPILTNATLVSRLRSSKPTVQRALDHLLRLGIIAEISGKQRHRRYSYQAYLEILTRDTTTRVG
jgi:Fic family protein